MSLYGENFENTHFWEKCPYLGENSENTTFRAKNQTTPHFGRKCRFLRENPENTPILSEMPLFGRKLRKKAFLG